MKKRLIIVTISISLLLLIFIILGQIVLINKQNNVVVDEVYKNSKVFKNDLLENVIDEFEVNSKKNGVRLEDFSLLKYENRTFFKVDISDLKNSSYLINYEGIDIKNIYVDIKLDSETKMQDVEKALITAIEVSDDALNNEEAIRIISYLYSKIDSNSNKSNLKYKNGLIYSLEVSAEGIIFIIS